MANFWNQSGVPHKGWTLENVFDLGEDYDSPDDIPYETCMMCGNTGIRFVHVVTHPSIGLVVIVLQK
jgi:hypothetical protein